MKRLYDKPLLIGCTRRTDGTPVTLYPHPVKDAEAFSRFYLDKAFETWGMFLRPEEYEESLSLLIIHLWRLEERFDPGRNDNFEGYARTYIARRAVDVGPRRILGRNGSKKQDYLFAELDENNEDTGLYDPLGEESSGAADHSEGDGQGVLGGRSSEEVQAAILLGLLAA